MLKNIIFIMKKNDNQENLPMIEELDMLKKRIKEAGSGIDVYFLSEEAALRYLRDGIEAQGLDVRYSLFVTDIEAALSWCIDKGYYAIAYMHNESQDMWQAKYAISEAGELEYESFVQVYQRLAGLPWHIADTKRLMIRETTQGDVEEFYQIYEEPSITYYMENLFEDIDAEKKYIQSYIDKIYGFYGYGIWTLVLKETGDVIGRAGLSWREGYNIPELGFVIGTKYQRQGFAYEACMKILDLARDEYEFEQVQALVEEGNKYSISLCYKLGFDLLRNIEEKGVKYLIFVKKV